MRVAPVGAFSAGRITEVIENARLSAEITHSHLEGIAGAVAVALAASFAATAEPDAYRPVDFFSYIGDNLPETQVRLGIHKAGMIPIDTPVTEAADRLGSGQHISAPDTVPFVIWNAAANLFEFEAAFWRTVEGLGDRDTTCAMVCGIVALSTRSPVPGSWIERTEGLPSEFRSG
jgi:ADP-ribosylglycohydrolase